MDLSLHNKQDLLSNTHLQGQRAEAEAQGNEESEAGPEAVAAVQQAMQQYGQGNDEDTPQQNARNLEEMMNAMIEQAYDEDMEVSISDGVNVQPLLQPVDSTKVVLTLKRLGQW